LELEIHPSDVSMLTSKELNGRASDLPMYGDHSTTSLKSSNSNVHRMFGR